MLKVETDSDVAKVWMREQDRQTLLEHAPSWDAEIAIRCMTRVGGVRSAEVPQLKPRGLRKETDDGGNELWLLTIPHGKDTSGGEGKRREAWVPDSTREHLRAYARERDISPSEPYLNVTPRTIQRYVSRAADRAAMENKNDDWKLVSSHDCRRHYAHELGVEKEIPLRVLQAWGGWQNLNSLKPYLTIPSLRRQAQVAHSLDW